ncbi:MFS transporter [Nocardia vaccinii]|uniref:MFS transporter n=1 Tax=Nocardia vaccinii TaxID=1822 RepID=UPI0014719459|nr:MFS transporter [Nocardia vaccinii]
MNVSSVLDRSKMRPLQYLVVAMCILCNAFDGYDIFITGFALPHLPPGFASSAEKGLLVSAGLVGMGVGALFLAPLADRFGRRTLIVAGLVIDVLGMSWSALAANATVLIFGRFVTGLGIGIITALIMVVAAEYTPARRRNTAIGLVTIGFPVGSTLAGLISVWLVDGAGGSWRSLFWVGAVLSFVGLLAVLVSLPESLEFLALRGTPQSLRKLEQIAVRLKLDTEGAGEISGSTTLSRGAARPLTAVLGPGLREQTLLLWLMYGFILAAFYFVTSWTPQLIAKATGDVSTGSVVGTALSVGSLAGSIVFAVLGVRVPAIHVAWVGLVVSAVGVIGFCSLLNSGVAVLIAIVLGLAIYTAVAAVTAMAPQMYSVELRATGYGSMVGVGRVGGIVAPILAGYALAVMTPRGMYAAASVPLVIAALAVIRLWQVARRRSQVSSISDTLGATTLAVELPNE